MMQGLFDPIRPHQKNLNNISNLSYIRNEEEIISLLYLFAWLDSFVFKCYAF
jgi:hypothetical protein